VIATDDETAAQQATPAPRPPAEAVDDTDELPVADRWAIEGSESGG
jgi:hypothetical protein